MSMAPWDELQELAADKYVARELDVSEWRLAEGDGYPRSSNRNRFEFLMWAQIRPIIERVATLTAERDKLRLELTAAQRGNTSYGKGFLDGREATKELRADQAALRTALEEVQLRARIMSVPDADCGEEVLRDVFLHIADLAREALGGKS